MIQVRVAQQSAVSVRIAGAASVRVDVTSHSGGCAGVQRAV